MASQERAKFELLDHTADTGIKIYGKSINQLFENAALGLFSVIADLRNVEPVTVRQVKLQADDQEELLVRWLSELNYLFFTRAELYNHFEIELLDGASLNARVRGESIDKSRHVIYTEVKAVTYHHLYIEKTSNGWEAQVIFDL